MYDFSYKSYCKLLEQFLLRRYVSTSYTGFCGTHSEKLLLRHDIDINLQSCEKIFEIEVEYGFHATWFIQPNNGLYNPLSTEALRILNQIAQHHSLGLHIDPCFAGDAKGLEAYINKAYDFYSNYLPLEPIFSFHRPSKFIKNLNLDIDGFTNAYCDSFVKDFAYFSDSNRNCFWEQDLFWDALINRRSINLLIHPVWWGEISLTLEEILQRLERQVKQMTRQVLYNNVTCFQETLNDDLF